MMEPKTAVTNSTMMWCRSSFLVALALAILGCAGTTSAQSTGAIVPKENVVPLTSTELRLRNAVRAHYDDYVTLLQRSVDIPSGSLNTTGVRQVGDLYAAELRKLGFETRLEAMPDSLHRGPHLVAVHRGTRGPRLLLIGHLDTVFEGEGQGWVREDTIAHGAGSSDMKGGDIGMMLALRALDEVGLLKEMRVTVVMTGDEESPGTPISVSRKALIDAANQSDIALAFEGGSAARVVDGRRGASLWRLSVTATQAHSMGIFRSGTGYGAVYEGARILDEFRVKMAGERGLTFNVGLVAGGAHVSLDTTSYTVNADGKSNIIPPVFVAQGDLRFLTEAQKDSARARMRVIVADSLEGARGSITFTDAYPAMAVTPAGERLLAMFSAASQSLGYPAVRGFPPEDRGGGDISFVAPLIPTLDGLGVSGEGAHSPRESVNLRSLQMSGERAAVLMRRLMEDWTVSR